MLFVLNYIVSVSAIIGIVSMPFFNNGVAMFALAALGYVTLATIYFWLNEKSREIFLKFYKIEVQWSAIVLIMATLNAFYYFKYLEELFAAMFLSFFISTYFIARSIKNAN